MLTAMELREILILVLIFGITALGLAIAWSIRRNPVAKHSTLWVIMLTGLVGFAGFIFRLPDSILLSVPVAIEATGESILTTDDSTSSSAGSTTAWKMVSTSLKLIWFAGILFGLASILTSMFRIRSIVGGIVPIDRNRFQDVLAQTNRNLNLCESDRRLRIGTSTEVHGPYAIHWLGKSWILLPSDYLESTTRQQLTQILTHEGAHIVRRDPSMKMLQQFYVALYWWNPLSRLLSRMLDTAREEICDNYVIRTTDPCDYGHTLVELTKAAKSHCGKLATGVAFASSPWTLESRLKGLLNEQRKRTVRNAIPQRAVQGLVFLGAIGLLHFITIDVRVIEPKEISTGVPNLRNDSRELVNDTVSGSNDLASGSKDSISGIGKSGVAIPDDHHPPTESASETEKPRRTIVGIGSHSLP